MTKTARATWLIRSKPKDRANGPASWLHVWAFMAEADDGYLKLDSVWLRDRLANAFRLPRVDVETLLRDMVRAGWVAKVPAGFSWIPSTVKRELRERLAAEHGWGCWYCGTSLNPAASPLSGVFPCLNHVVPVPLGGTDRVSNLVLSCRSCSSKKGQRTGGEYRALSVAMVGSQHEND